MSHLVREEGGGQIPDDLSDHPGLGPRITVTKTTAARHSLEEAADEEDRQHVVAVLRGLLQFTGEYLTAFHANRARAQPGRGDHLGRV